ncbi:hypothetical protein [Aquisphaera giovannonii]|nr:hypothetical protein [Aquisphaera giovannonii]
MKAPQIDASAEVESSLSTAIGAWTERGRPGPLERWLGRHLDEDGTPHRIPHDPSSPILDSLLTARGERPGWPDRIDERLGQIVRCLLRTSRVDLTPATRAAGSADATLARATLVRFAESFPRSAEAQVIAWWVRGVPAPHVPPPLPAWSSARRAMAVLRPGWQKADDLLVVDHRQAGSTTDIGLVGAGVPWLGPSWQAPSSEERATAARPTFWQSTSAADLFEWTFTVGGLRHTRSALLLRGRSLALLADQVEGQPLRAAAPGPAECTIALPEGIQPAPIAGSRGLLLRPSEGRKSAQVLPVALPCADYQTDLGRFAIAPGGRLSMAVAPAGRRCWLPLLVSWDAARHRKTLSWRVLTVSQDSKICGRDVALAVRVSWGREETFVIYRSLAAPASRVFLGHQTGARFLVGTFSTDGDVEPILAVE